MYTYMYKAFSIDHSLLPLNLPFKVNLRRLEIVFLMSGALEKAALLK